MTPPESLSPELRAFIAEAPAARQPHLDFFRRFCATVPPGSSVLDVGAGDTPYRELFDAYVYRTSDWSQTSHSPANPVDIVAPADALPIQDGAIDAIVCTQVLEHVPEPLDVLREFYRVVRPGGSIWITTPLTWFLHEEPHDYYRYTSHGLRYLISKAGFVDVGVEPMNNSGATLAELLRQFRWMLGTTDDGLDAARAAAGNVVGKLAAALDEVGYLDTCWKMPISFSAVAFKA